MLNSSLFSQIKHEFTRIGNTLIVKLKNKIWSKYPNWEMSGIILFTCPGII